MSLASGSAAHNLARFWGVEISYQNNQGTFIEAHDDALLAVLSAMAGEEISNSRDAQTTLEYAKRERADRILEPVVVHRAGAPTISTVTLGAGVDTKQVHVTLRMEDGEEWRSTLAETAVAISPSVGDAEGIVRYRFTAAPEQTPPGYHLLSVELPDRSAEALLIAAPARCPVPERSWGSFLPLYALRPESGDWGIGSFLNLGDMADLTVTHGAGFVGTLPLLSPFIDPEKGYLGPYVPESKLAWNEAYIDVPSIAELANSDEFASKSRSILESVGLTDELAVLSGLELADLEAVLRLKRPILELLARSISGATNQRRSAFEEFIRLHPHLVERARFKAACDHHGAHWRSWPEAAPRSLPSGSIGEDLVAYHLYVQWIADQQLEEECGDRLYLDVPIGVHPSGFDTWWEPDSFVSKVSGGAPPDAFFAGGQSWGFPPLHPHNLRHRRYGYFISSMRHVMTRASVVRIDHVMGLHRLYWVPDGTDARHGVYVKYNADELHAIIVLESTRAGCAVVGEDLGTVPGEVRRSMDRDGMLSSFVFQFSSSTENPLPEPSDHQIATFGTHDLPTFSGYWSGLDIDERRESGLIDAAQAQSDTTDRAEWRSALSESLGLDATTSDVTSGALKGVLVHLSRSPAPLMMFDVEDLWLEPEQQNHPGSGPEAGNFKRRASHSLATLRDPRVEGLMDALTAARSGPEVLISESTGAQS
ncbi:MAG: 4-alpha-glucanotransferase [Acidimicrobiales bacterium]